MLYTAIPIEWILEEEEEETPAKKRREITMNGVRLIVEPNGEDSFEIVQLISSDPSHYLASHYQPGQSLRLRPLL